MAYQLITPAAGEPLTLAEAKAHLRVDLADDDLLITSLISAARQHAEFLTGRQLLSASWQLVIDQFPRVINLERCPVLAVQSLQYLDTQAVWRTMPSTDYVLDVSTEPARITPVFGKIWPIAMPQIGSVKINFTSGYGTAYVVPEGIKSWMKLRVASLYQHREEVAILPSGRLDPLPFVDGLLDPYRVVSY